MEFGFNPQLKAHPHLQRASLEKRLSRGFALFSTSTKPFLNFEEKDNLHPNSKRAVADMGLTTMTEIQVETFDAVVDGKDLLARARTGTGKTLAYLLPAIESVLNRREASGKSKQTPGLEILILSPTRELALQIYEQAKLLLSFHQSSHGKLGAQVVFGGSSKQKDCMNFNKQLPTILVATPGRLKDHLETTWIPSSTSQSLSDIMRSNVQIVIVDEMDRLLDMGFVQDIQNILSHLPHKTKRQTLLFSATVPPQLKSVLETTMKRDYVTIDCIQDLDPATHTNALVQQSHVIVPALTKWVSSTVETILYIMLQSKLVNNENTSTPYKIVAFFPTTNLVAYYADLFNFGLGIKVMELHSRKSQNYRTSVSNRFREVTQGILFTSDVSARGVDYPNVTHVIQFGMADGRETYIHRLGRTGRAAKKGIGLLVVTDVEGPGFLQSCISDLDVSRNKERELEACILMDFDEEKVAVEMENEGGAAQNDIKWAVKREAKRLLDPVLESVKSGKNIQLQTSAEDAYRSLLGFYMAKLPAIGIKSKHTLVSKVNAFAKQAGLNNPPMISRKLAKTLGLDKMEGIRVMEENHERRKDDNGGRERHRSDGDRSRRGAARSGKEGNLSINGPTKTKRSPSYEEWGTRMPINAIKK